DGASPLTPTPPVAVTGSGAVNVSPRRAPPGADSEATSADGVCTAIAGEPTDPADKAGPEFASAPVAPADRVSESGGAPPAVNVQENTTVLPPGTSTGAAAGDAVRLAEPAAAATDGGLGTGATSRASASPVLLTPRVAMKLWPGATIGGTVSQRAEICAAAWTKTMSQVACTVIVATARVAGVTTWTVAYLRTSTVEPSKASCPVAWSVSVAGP